MNARAFIDTSVFVYSLDRSATAAKRRIATDLIRDALQQRRSIISYQVIQEFLAVVTKKFAKSMTIADAGQYLDDVLEPLLSVQPPVEIFREALSLHSRYHLSWYDSSILAAASIADCAVIYSEDLQHGAKYGGVRVENPFRTL
jgi:predicted nucleic acid-binding protein